jgi:hypothetical protein
LWTTHGLIVVQASDVAKSLADRGLTSLPQKEKKEVERAAKDIPPQK